MLRSQELFPEFEQQVKLTPFSKDTWRDAQEFTTGSAVERAVKFFLRFRMSRGGEGRDFTTPVRTRTRGQKQDQVNAYLSAVDGLPDAHERLRRVLVLNRDAVDVISSEDAEHTLFYLDPPYPHSTRGKADLYRSRNWCAFRYGLGSYGAQLSRKANIGRLFSERPTISGGACGAAPQSHTGPPNRPRQ